MANGVLGCGHSPSRQPTAENNTAERKPDHPFSEPVYITLEIHYLFYLLPLRSPILNLPYTPSIQSNEQHRYKGPARVVLALIIEDKSGTAYRITHCHAT